MLRAKTTTFFIKFENIPFYVAEIEAHNLGKVIFNSFNKFYYRPSKCMFNLSIERSVEEPLLIYRGCFKKFPSLEYVKAGAARCRRHCFTIKKYIYFALKVDF